MRSFSLTYRTNWDNLDFLFQGQRYGSYILFSVPGNRTPDLCPADGRVEPWFVTVSDDFSGYGRQIDRAGSNAKSAAGRNRFVAFRKDDAK